MSQSPIICVCQHVREDRIEAACRDGARTLDEVRARTRACTSRGDCAADIEEILRDVSS